MSEETWLLKAEGLAKGYPQGQGRLEILKGVDFQLRPKDCVSIVGASGSGKSTLLHILGTLDNPDEGKLFFKGEDLSQKDENEISLFRNKSMGFVFQFHHLLNEFTALENVAMPALIGGISRSQAFKKAQELLDTLGLKDRMKHYPSELSGGEQQRVAISRAIVMEPQILFADEPTGNLDRSSREGVQEILMKLHKTLGVALVVVTHNRSLAQAFPKTLEMRDRGLHSYV